MSRVRTITFGSVPPEWGGERRGGVATFHATLVNRIHHAQALPVDVVGLVTSGSGRGSAPVPLLIAPSGPRREEFLRSILDQLRPDVALLNRAIGWVRTLRKVAPELPLVGIAHSWHGVTYSETPSAALDRMQQALDGLAALVVPSEHCLREGRSLGLRYPAAIHVVRYPLPSHFEAPVDLAQPRESVLFAGELTPRKNPSALVEAMTLLPGLSLALAGDGPELGRLRETVDRLGVAPRVKFLGSVDHQRLAEAMSRAVAFCLPSLSESFGIVYIEALACGTPVIGFAPTLAEIALRCEVDVGVGLRTPDRDAIALAVEQVRSAQWDRAQLRAAVVRGYSAGTVAQEYARILAEAASKASAQQGL